MRAREEILKEIQWQIDDYRFYRQLYYNDLLGESDFFRDAGKCLHRIYALLWCMGCVDKLGSPDLSDVRVFDMALALLDNANITSSC